MSSTSDSGQATDGLCDSRFLAVREAFRKNLQRDDEVGAAVTIYVGGEKVVDLFGGYANSEKRTPWRSDTLVNAYSTGKGVLAILALHLVDLGILDFDRPVRELWPEFAAEGKGETRLRDLLSHRVGLPAVRERLGEGSMFDWTRMTRALASQAPYWTPGEHHGYHVNTFGFLVGEIIRRATEKTVGQALEHYLTGPLGADFNWGLPRSEHHRVARVYSVDAGRALSGPDEWKFAFPPTGDDAHDQMIWHTYFNPSGLSGGGVVNTEDWRLAAIPSTNGHGNARALAVIYNAVLSNSKGGSRLASRDVITEATKVASDGKDMILGKPSRFSLGFQLPQPKRPIGPNPESFGHYGYGGSLGFADPSAGVAFGYVRNRLGKRWHAPCTEALIDSLYSALQG